MLEYVDVGFALLPNYESLGLAHEASIEIIKLAKNVFKLDKIVAITTPDNDSSIKLLKKFGFCPLAFLPFCPPALLYLYILS